MLVSAVIQGAAFYWAQCYTMRYPWLSSDRAWLIGLYAVASIVPITFQLLVEHARRTALWLILAAWGGAAFYFGWEYGATVNDLGGDFGYLAFGFILTVLWLLVLPFVQSGLAAAGHGIHYRSLFAYAWRNMITLTEAALFTGLFWLLLYLWASLFQMVGIGFFSELFFHQTLFICFVTPLALGCALYLVGSIEQLVSALLAQILNVMKWLAVVAGLLLALFTAALALKLPGLVFSGERAIGSAWLLWLVAVVVLLLNAAYQDGAVEQPLPKWVALSLRIVTPLTMIISFTALYALLVRTQHYGLTVERVWAFVVAGTALMYSVGYSIAALGKGGWLIGMARVNVAVATALIVAIASALTPLMSPYRLAANSQYRAVLAGRYGSPEASAQNSPLLYLRFYSGRYGMDRLSQLTRVQGTPDAGRIRELAAATIAMGAPWVILPEVETYVSERVAKLAIYPAGRALDANLSGRLINECLPPHGRLAQLQVCGIQSAGIFIDLNGDGIDEFVLMTADTGLENGGLSGFVYKNDAGNWNRIGGLYPVTSGPQPSWAVVVSELRKGDFAVQGDLELAASWKELVLGPERLRVRQ